MKTAVHFALKQVCSKLCFQSMFFTTVLQWATRSSRLFVSQVGFDLGDGQPRPLDFLLADDILLFLQSADEARVVLASLIGHLANVGLILNAGKTVILTTEGQARPHIGLAHGQLVTVLRRHVSHRWLGCLLSAANSAASTSSDVYHHLSAVLPSFFGNGWILRDRHVSVRSCLNYLHAVITLGTCFSAGHRTIHNADLVHLNIQFKHVQTLIAQCCRSTRCNFMG